MERQREHLESFACWLRSREKSANTVEKYMRDARHFLEYAGEEGWEKETVIRYKEYLRNHYKTSSVNSMLVALNCYLRFVGRAEDCVNICRIQRRLFCEESKELTMEEYKRLIRTAKKENKSQIGCIMQTIAATGIRVSELKYITVEALKCQVAVITCKGKQREILLPQTLIRLLREYCRERGIERGSIFLTKKGRPVDRRSIWAGMKKLCASAGVIATKVFPHNLRHLFARCYYEREKDLVRLADYLGHSSVETTRRYTMVSTREAYRKTLELGFVIEWDKKYAVTYVLT